MSSAEDFANIRCLADENKGLGKYQNTIYNVFIPRKERSHG
jgi:hypothetical protein